MSQLKREADVWHSKYMETGELDLDAFNRMGVLRRELIATKSEDNLDTLMHFGCVRAVVSYLYLGLEGEVEDASAILEEVRLGLVEILSGLHAIRPKLEMDAGQTLEGLGLFVDGKALQ
jgi:hypothetical protein